MKKLIYTILASLFLLSCSSNSANEDSNNSSGTGLLIKTTTSGSQTTTFNYNGNKLLSVSMTNGLSSTFTYSGTFIISQNTTDSNNPITSNIAFNYSNNLLSSSAENLIINNSSYNYNNTYTYNSDGSITENSTRYNPLPAYNKFIRFYSQGNCIREDHYNTSTGSITFTGSINYSYDTKNLPYKNITGFYAWQNPRGASINNVINKIEKNASGVITKTVQTTYQYNSQNYPISGIETSTNYNFDSQSGTSTPGTPTTSNITFTYY